MIYFICPEWGICEPAPSITLAVKWLFSAWKTNDQAWITDEHNNILAKT